VTILPGQYIDTSVTNNQTYYYWLVSHNAYGNGPAVATGAVTPSAGGDSSSTPSRNIGGLLVLIILLVVIVVVVLLLLQRRKKKKGQ